MRSTLSKVLLVGGCIAMLASPALAQAGPPGDSGGFGQGGPGGPPQDQPRKRRHHGDVGAGIAAGVLGGLAGAAIVGGANRPPPPPPGYDYPPPPPPPGPRYGAYEEDVSCRIIRKPVYDEDGEVVSYRTRRICD